MIKTHQDGSKEYWVDGRLHREDGPAIDYVNGTQYWYKHGKLHREDGPAIMWWDGRQYWFLDDLEYTFYQFQYAKKYKFLRYIQRVKFYMLNKFYGGIK